MSAHRVNVPAAAVPALAGAAAAAGTSLEAYCARVLTDHAATLPVPTPAELLTEPVALPFATFRLSWTTAQGNVLQELWERGSQEWRLSRVTRALIRYLGIAPADREIRAVWRIDGWVPAMTDGRWAAIGGEVLTPDNTSDSEKQLLAQVVGSVIPVSRNPVRIWGI